MQDYRSRISKDEDFKITKENRYSTKFIVRLIAKKEKRAKVFFYFRSNKDYITLSWNGQLNTRGEDDMFKPWGRSEFRNLKPQSVFEELENEILKINLFPAIGRRGYSFNSYNEFINWLGHGSYRS